jgi:hypothetical protein
MQCNGTCLYILTTWHAMFSFVYNIKCSHIISFWHVRVSIHTDVWQICIDSVIRIVCRFYVNPDSKYLHVGFVICAGSIKCLHITCLLWPYYTKALTKYNIVAYSARKFIRMLYFVSWRNSVISLILNSCKRWNRYGFNYKNEQ